MVLDPKVRPYSKFHPSPLVSCSFPSSLSLTFLSLPLSRVMIEPRVPKEDSYTLRPIHSPSLLDLT